MSHMHLQSSWFGIDQLDAGELDDWMFLHNDTI